jgi:hypothetical protein
MTLGNAVAARLRLIGCAGIAVTRSNAIQPKWPGVTELTRPCRIGASGWCAGGAAGGLHKKAILQKRSKPIGTTGLCPKKAGLPARTQS